MIFWTPTQTAEPVFAPTRRLFLAGCGAFALGLGPGRVLAAMDADSAGALVQGLVDEVNATIRAGGDEAAMIRDFERIFATYCDVPAMARAALGPVARSTPERQMRDYAEAFRLYVARKYGRRFREFVGGEIIVAEAKPLRSYFEVATVVHLRGRTPIDMRWHVSDRGGRPLFFNMVIEGVNMLAAERTEIGAMLDRRRGDVAALIADLRAT